MFEHTRRTLGFHVARFRLRKEPRDVVAFTIELSCAKRALLIMPLGGAEFLPTVLVIDMLRRKYGERNLTVVTDRQGIEVHRALPHSTFIHLLNTDLNALYLPHRNVLHQITQNSYDVAIDLNLDLILPSGYICRASAATVRIGFVRKHADVFYNFQIRPDSTLSRKLVYDRLAKCLQMF
jgi:ADP-heptose:LPS heptosyltransferase